MASLEKVAASAASSAATPAGGPTTPTTEAAAGTTVQPGQPGANAGVQGAEANTGEDAAWLAIPETRRNTILENTRKKERDAILTAVEAKFGWAKDVKPEMVESAFGLAQRVATNPVQFVVDLIAEIRSDPKMAAALAAQMGQPGAQPVTGQPGGWKGVKPRLKADDGTMAYSAEQVTEILQGFREDLMGEFGNRLSPLEDFRGSLEEREQVMHVIQETRTETANLMTEMRALDHWPKPDATGKRAGEAKIAGYLAAIPQETKRRIGAIGSMYQAYNTYLQKDVFPTLASTTEQEVRDGLRRKAVAANGSVTPQTATPQAGVKKPSNPKELAEHMARMAVATT